MASRITESAIIVTGLMSLLMVTTLRDDFSDTVARPGPLDMVVMYRSQLLPPRMALLGLVGAPPALLGGLLVVLGATA